MEYRLRRRMRWWGAARERRQREDFGEQDYCPFEEKGTWLRHKIYLHW